MTGSSASIASRSPISAAVSALVFLGQGAPEVVLLRGRVLVEEDELVAQPGAGEFVKRARFGEELRRQAPTQVG